MTRLCLALAFLMASYPAQARTPVYARIKCLGLYCMIVDEPDQPLPPAPTRGEWNRKSRHFPWQCGS